METTLIAIVLIILGTEAFIFFKKPRSERSISKAQIQLSVLTIVLLFGAVAYRILVWGHLEQTSALFIGLPTFLSLILIFTPKSESVTGMILKGITLALLMSGILLGEGFICIMMSAPLFYLIAIAIGSIIDRRKKNGQKINSIIVLPFLLMSLEGTSDRFSFKRAEVVTVQKKIATSKARIMTQLAETPRFSTPLPFYLKMGFPKPVTAQGSGLEVGNYREINFAGGEGRPGALRLIVKSSNDHEIIFETISDTSHIAHWLDWNRSIVEIEEVTPNESIVSWTIVYDRRLDPGWYFGPWERYAVGLSAEYLIDNLATPGDSRLD